MNTKTHQRQFRQAEDFKRVRNVSELCRLLKIDKRRLSLMVKQPRYNSFSIPKKGGGERHIETPAPPLKKVQAKLNRYLQSVYYFEKSSASYGFILGVRNDEDRRNVLTNAKKHLGRPYLLNIDMKDFFHSVSKKRVLDIFENPPFDFQKDLAAILAKLTTHKERLPMGTPTSPVLSNFACKDLDQQLISLSRKRKWMFTRYADDLSFSAHSSFSQQDVETLGHIIQEQGFIVNKQKLKQLGPKDAKIVTGLLLADKVELAPGYLSTLESDIRKLKQVMEVQNVQGELSSKWVEDFKRQIRGRLNFAGFVIGRRKKVYIDLKDQYYTAINPPEEDFGAVSWRSFPYNG